MALANIASKARAYPTLERFGQFVSITDYFREDTGSATDLDPATRHHLDLMAVYCRDFLTKPHPSSGRAGPVCPYTRRAVARSLMLLTHCDDDGSDDAALVRALLTLRSAYLERDAELPEDDRLFHAIVITFPQVPARESAALIQRLHAILKPEFTGFGLMIGEFYPGCPAPGLYNPEFRPLQTPVAALVIRHMTVRDAPFLVGNPLFEANYERQFGADGTRHLQTALDRLTACPVSRADAARSADPILQPA
jgi:hypothetical protein